MNRALLTAALALLMLMPLALAYADEGEGEPDVSIEDGVAQWLDSIDWSAMEALLSALPEEVRALWDNGRARDTAERIATEGTFSQEPIHQAAVGAIRAVLMRERGRLLGLLSSLLGVSVLAALVGAIASDEGKGAGEAAAFVARCFALTILLTAFNTYARVASEGVERLCAFMERASPVLLTLLTAMGCTAGAGVFSPAFALLASGMGALMKGVIVPLTLCFGVLAMFESLSERASLGEMSALIKRAVKWIIGGASTLYAAITSIRGMSAAAYDSVTIRTAKYAANSAVPMAGSLIGGAFDTVIGCAGLVKNATGLTLMLLGVCALIEPLVRICLVSLTVRLAAALLQPLGDKRMVGMMRAGADMLSVVGSACAVAAAMFLITTGLIAGLGNGGYWG